MRGALLLAWRYVAYNRLKTTILVACITMTLFLPITVHVLVRHYNAELIARAEATPLIVGAKGNRYDLCLGTLYFSGRTVDGIDMREAVSIRETEFALPIPIHARFTAKGFQVVGTTLDYFEFRKLAVREGTLPLVLGDAVVGSEVAERLSLGPGSVLLSDQHNLYDISRSYPLKMHVVGALARSDTPDDRAVFVDVKTAWIIEGLAHGHQDMTKPVAPDLVLEREDDNVVATAAVFEYTEVTPENIGAFHFHGDPLDFPLTAVIAIPASRKAETLLKGRYELSENRQMFEPSEVIGELMGIVFKVEMFFRANFVVVVLSTALFLMLVVLLSMRIRQREMRTMFRIGASRGTVFWLQAAELGIVLLIGLCIAGIVAGAVILFTKEFVRML